MLELSLDISNLLQQYRSGELRPTQVVELVLERIASGAERNAWISVLSREQLQPYLDRLENIDPQTLPLYGIPFAIKDNIDLAGIPTTAACPDYSYVPEHSATVVQHLVDAGALPIGKTNLDQFATGLVGARSPYGPGRNVFDSAYISGGSSAGSAISVAAGEVSFSLGTDTAGSGRVPAAFNNLIGLKPTRGRLSTHGVVPACRSLDCVSVFALTAGDAQQVLEVAGLYDPLDSYARPAPAQPGHFIPAQGFRFGVARPEQLEFFDNDTYRGLYAQAVAGLERMGGTAVEVDLEPLLAAARLLYDGPWLAERYAAVGDFLERAPEAFFPVTRDIIAASQGLSAVDAFKGQYRLAELKALADRIWGQVDVMVTPTAGTIYRIDEVDADPVRTNANLGYYTNFMNLLDYAAVAVPAGFGGNRLPFGLTLFAPAFSEAALLALADSFHRNAVASMGATAVPIPPAPSDESESPCRTTPIAVCGAHMAGLPLNHQLTERGARLLRRTHTAPEYRLVTLPGGPPQRPGLVRTGAGGEAVEVEIWEMPSEQVGSFLAGIPAPLGLGQVALADGTTLPGFLCEAYAAEQGEDISALRGWRAYLSQAC